MIGFGQQTYVPDDVFEEYIETNFPLADNGVVNDNYVKTTGVNLVPYLLLAPAPNGGLANGIITDLTGIEDFKSLYHLDIQNQQISEIDLSQTKFNSFSFGYPLINIGSNNLLNKIILPNDTVGNTTITANNFMEELIFLDSIFFNSQFQISYNTSLLSCDISVIIGIGGGAGFQVWNNNSLEILNLANGFCNNWSAVSISGNPTLFCIQVDNPNYSEIVWSWNGLLIDPLLYSYSTNCGWPSSISDHTSNKQLLKVTDLLGRETKGTNQSLFYIYDDGTVEKRIVIE